MTGGVGKKTGSPVFSYIFWRDLDRKTKKERNISFATHIVIIGNQFSKYSSSFKGNGASIAFTFFNKTSKNRTETKEQRVEQQ